MKGHVRNRGTNSRPNWQYMFYININGKRKCISKSGFKRRKLAEEALTFALSQYQKNNFVENKNISFKDIAEDYIENYIKSHKALSTYDKFQSQYKKYLALTLGNIKISKINSTMINDVIQKSKVLNPAKPLANSTLKSIYSLINSIFNRAIKLELIYKNPCVNADKVTIKPVFPKTLEVSDISSVLSLLNTTKYTDFLIATIIIIASETGMRRGEICGLTWDNINFYNNTLTVRNTLGYIDGHTHFQDFPKTKASLRVIPFSQKVRDLLLKLRSYNEAYKDIYKDEYLEPYFNDKHVDLVFRHSNGQHIHPMWPYNRFKKLIKKANLDLELTFHSLRHSFASIFLNVSNGDLATLSVLMGHSDKAFTFKKYCHLLQSHQRDAINNFSIIMPSINFQCSI